MRQSSAVAQATPVTWTKEAENGTGATECQASPTSRNVMTRRKSLDEPTAQHCLLEDSQVTAYKAPSGDGVGTAVQRPCAP
jgi:hypothetical protein